MRRTITYIVTEKEDGLTIKELLLKKGYSHPILVQLKKTSNAIIRKDEWLYFHSKVKHNDEITVIIEETATSDNIVASEYAFDIIYEDEDILVVNKSYHMPIHPSMNNYDNSLANALMHYYRNEDTPFVFRCINRLDKDTSGLTIIAKNPLSAAILYRDMTKRRIKRYYYALVEGTPNEKGTIDIGISRVEGSTIMRQADANGERAITHFTRLKGDSYTSLVECLLETGRTHQIRVHMKHIGHPLLGDYIYNPENTTFDHQALHAGKLIFTHPTIKKELTLTAPFPKDLSSFIESYN